MKKYILITIIASISALSYTDNLKVSVNSNFKSNMQNGKGSLEYKPLDIKIKTKDSKFNFNFVVKGKKYKKMTKVEEANKYFIENTKTDNKERIIKEETDIFTQKPNRRDINKFSITDEDLKKDYNEEKLGKYNLSLPDPNDPYSFKDVEKDFSKPEIVKNLIFLDNHNSQDNFKIDPHLHTGDAEKDHEHHEHAHEHDHDHEHDHEHGHHDHGHAHSNSDFGLEHRTYFFKTKRIDESLNAKLSLGYTPDLKKSLSSTLYLSDFEDNDIKYKLGGFVLDGKYTGLVKDNLSLSTLLKYHQRDITTPLLIDNENHIRFKKDDNTVISGKVQNILQLEGIEYIKNYKNVLNFTYDYNKEETKAHDFYEILDHEHEKINQLKVGVDFKHKGVYEDNKLKGQNLKYYTMKDKYDLGLNLVTKKTFDNGIYLQNSAKLNYGLSANRKNDIHIEKTSKYYKRKNGVGGLMGHTMPPQYIPPPSNIGGGMAPENNFEMAPMPQAHASNLPPAIISGTIGVSSEKLISKEGIEIKEIKSNNMTGEVLVTTSKYTNPKQYTKTYKNDIKLKDEVEFGYKDENDKFSLKTGVDFSYKVESNKLKVANDTSLKYARNITNDVEIHTGFNNNYKSNIKDFWQTESGINLGMKYNPSIYKFDIQSGFDIDLSLNHRKAKNVVDKKEENKVLRGYKISLKPSLKVSSNLNNNVTLYTKVTSDLKFEKAVLDKQVDKTLGLVQDDYEKADDNMKFKSPNINFEIGLKMMTW